MTTIYKPSPWYRERNSKIYAQAATMSVSQIAEYWRLDVEWVKDIIDKESNKRIQERLVEVL